MTLVKTLSQPEDRALDLAPVLLVDDDVASRLTLRTLLRAGGYCVDVASSAAEAIEKLDTAEYSLVLNDLRKESEEGRKVLAYARDKDYRPATASLTKYHGSDPITNTAVVVEAEDVPTLLDQVAELIGLRAMRRSQRQLRHALS
jgi:CheY-like chemotaxis protein